MQPAELARAKETSIALATTALEDVRNLTDGQALRGSKGVLVAEGDSWFDYPFFNVLTVLQARYGYRVESVADNGDWLESMAYDRDQQAAMALMLQSLRDRGLRKPCAVLLSGGGNDIAGPQLTMLLNHRRSGLPPVDRQIEAGLMINRLRTAMVTLIGAVSKLNEEIFGSGTVPIIIHGYDYPIPDGRGYLGGFAGLPGPWLRPAFDTKGYTRRELAEATAVMKDLIDQFNAMAEGIREMPGLDHVRFVHVLGTLSRDLDNDAYQGDWGNELHPTRSGFTKVAKLFAEALPACQ
jgi:hypothetical protein